MYYPLFPTETRLSVDMERFIGFSKLCRFFYWNEWTDHAGRKLANIKAEFQPATEFHSWRRCDDNVSFMASLFSSGGKDVRQPFLIFFSSVGRTLLLVWKHLMLTQYSCFQPERGENFLGPSVLCSNKKYIDIFATEILFVRSNSIAAILVPT